jgi:pectinesterase
MMKKSFFKLFAIVLFFGTTLQLTAEKAIVIGLIGDSTVAEQSGWGPAFASRFNENVKILNYAKNGATAPSLFKKLDLLLQHKPDYVFVQFGHNDQKRFEPNAYRDNLKIYVEKIQNAKAKPVIVSSVTRRSFNEKGKIVSLLLKSKKYNYKANLTVYAETAKSLAKELHLDFIDLHARSIDHHNQIGPTESMSYNFKEGDTTHFNHKGAQAITDLIVEEMNSVLPQITKHLK